MFYPKDEHELRMMITSCLGSAIKAHGVPKALIAPHAGYIYSGPIAGSAYASVEPARDTISRVVVIGPSHRATFRGIATSGADCFSTPLGSIPLDKEAIGALAAMPDVQIGDEAHGPEHCIEVHLPFLQVALNEFTLVPLLVGQGERETVADALEVVWGGDETLIVVSSDLSHYQDYDTARALDHQTTRAIERLDAGHIGPKQACGSLAIQGLLCVAQRKGLGAETIDVRNSGDTAGPRNEVVGYGAYSFA
jgi:AmmeMemoRadiSam system protein B